MLHCNIDMNTGLVNGAISTVFCLPDRTCHGSVCEEQIENFFHLQEAFPSYLGICCYHPQVPRLVIRRCHSGPLRRSVECWNGLVPFNPDSIMVTTSCLKEINHLRAAYRPVFYPLLAPPKTGQKHKHTGSTQHNKPKPKNPHGAITDSPNKG